MLKNDQKEEYLKLKLNVLLPLNKILVLLGYCVLFIFQDPVNVSIFCYILSNASSPMPLAGSPLFHYLCYNTSDMVS